MSLVFWALGVRMAASNTGSVVYGCFLLLTALPTGISSSEEGQQSLPSLLGWYCSSNGGSELSSEVNWLASSAIRVRRADLRMVRVSGNEMLLLLVRFLTALAALMALALVARTVIDMVWMVLGRSCRALPGYPRY